MKTIKNLERLQRLHNLIEQECTGSPKELADKLHMSERMAYNLIEQLKSLEATILYSRSRKTYYYDKDFKLEVNISVVVMSNSEVTQIFAGSYFSKKNTILQGLCSEQIYIYDIKTKMCA
ncbi:HTH domain-containing protein [Galbibacter sp. BG1]|uniref:HTH domain-containing protein n=1 Tax=Galbibacter sp. BG1 TaxID=1170699 RepID=UPI0015BD9A65|nr:HTH domain-containing protein [Galbibacter sp. BG1]QLE00945.1 HTH domain-containing protein [Galbibacter sp. BG1]